MNKFKVGDEVVCVDDEDGDLIKFKNYKCFDVDNTYFGKVQLEQDGEFYHSCYFELLSEWASHQVPVSTETELALTKLQVKMLQDWKKDVLYLLNCMEDESVSKGFKGMVQYFLDNNKLKGFYD